MAGTSSSADRPFDAQVLTNTLGGGVASGPVVVPPPPQDANSVGFGIFTGFSALFAQCPKILLL